MELFVFVCATAMILTGAVGVIVRSHPVHAALSLILTLFGVAVMFVAQNAHFLAAVQVIVYAGAIVVLFLFVIMLLGVDKAENLTTEPFKIQRPLAAVVGVGTVGLLIAAIVAARKTVTAVAGTGLQGVVADPAIDRAGHDGNIRQLARDLFGNHVLAFELTSVLLVIAVVATVLMARKPRRGETEIDPPVTDPSTTTSTPASTPTPVSTTASTTKTTTASTTTTAPAGASK